jgi:hypothetical protein
LKQLANASDNRQQNSAVITSHLVIAASVSALGGLLFGYDNIVISAAIHY